MPGGKEASDLYGFFFSFEAGDLVCSWQKGSELSGQGLILACEILLLGPCLGLQGLAQVLLWSPRGHPEVKCMRSSFRLRSER